MLILSGTLIAACGITMLVMHKRKNSRLKIVTKPVELDENGIPFL